MAKKKRKQNKEDNFTPALKALLKEIDGEDWQMVTFEIADDD